MQRSLPSLESLPPEQSGHSLKFVCPPHLCNLALTSSKMRALADNPKLWSGMRLNKEKIKQEGLDKLFSINRFTKVREIDLSNMEFTNEELQRNFYAIKSSSVKDLNLKNVNVSEVPPVLLAQTVSQVNTINLGSTNLTTEQSIAVLETCISSDQLMAASFKEADLKAVPPQLLGEAAHHLYKISLAVTDLKTEHCLAVLEACVSSAKLVDVSFVWAELDEVPADLLGRAAKHLQKINLANTFLDTEHCISVLEACVSSAKLVDVSLAESELSEVPAELLGRAAKHLYNIDLSNTFLDTEQCIAVLEACVSSAKLVDVSLADADLSDVPVELLGQAAKHLQRMNLSCAELTDEQCIAVVEACISSGMLVEVSLELMDLSAVPAELLARASTVLKCYCFDGQ